MKIAIIGAGFTGLSSGFKLANKKHEVTIFEKESLPGGLAIGFKNEKWKWFLEMYYHHWFTNDNSILNLAKNINYPIITKKPETSVYVNNKSYKLDSPVDVLRFPELNILQRFRMGLAIAFLKYNPFWKLLEPYRANEILPQLMGKKPYNLLWKPLIIKKFGKFYSEISLAWFWARIVKRTPSLIYPKEGFQGFANVLAREIQKKGGKIFFKRKVNKFRLENDGRIKIGNFKFDKVIFTLPSPEFIKLTDQFNTGYKKSLLKLNGLGAMTLVICLKKQFFKNNTYWLNVCDMKYPITGIVEHTNFIDKKYYDNNHIIYVLNYLSANHHFMHEGKNDLLKIYDALLSKINKDYKSNIIGTYLFRTPFAQPIIPINYSKIIPSFGTPLENVYLANIQQIYPWDRETNYSVELGERVADFIMKK